MAQAGSPRARRAHRVRAAGARGHQQQAGDLRHAGLEMVDDLHDLVVARAHLAAHARMAGAQLQLGDAHDVVEGHPQRQPARRFQRCREAGCAGGIGSAFGSTMRARRSAYCAA
jgi:hypothetical protein